MSMRLNHLTVSHAGTALVDVSALDFEPGLPVTIVGESGSGKSLLAHAIMGTLPSNLLARGSMHRGRPKLRPGRPDKPAQLWGPVMALLPQEPALALDPTMRAREQVAEGARVLQHGQTGSAAYSRSPAGLPRTRTRTRGVPAHPLRRYGPTGRVRRRHHRQRPCPDSDEPSKGLDQQARADLEELLKRHLDGGGILSPSPTIWTWRGNSAATSLS